MAGSSVLARIGCAVIDIILTVFTTKTINTQAFEFSCAVQAGSTILAGRACTIIGIDQTISSFISMATLASIPSFGVDTSSSVAARVILSTFIDVFITESSSKPERT